MPAVLPERVTVRSGKTRLSTYPALIDADDVMERMERLLVIAVTVTVPLALLMVVPLDGLDSVTEKVRSLTCEALFSIVTKIVLDVSPAANESVPEVAV